jgi:putative phosphoesterase
VDLVLHAGDLEDPSILHDLGQIAPVHAVRGNLHLQALRPNDQGLPLFLELDIGGYRIVVTHGHFTLWNSLREKFWLLVPDGQERVNRRIVERLARAFLGADVIVFGHSHRAMVQWRDGTLFINPGAVCPTRTASPSVARLTVTRTGPEAEILRMDDG